MVIPLHLTVHVHETHKNYFLLFIKVLDQQFLLMKRHRGLEREVDRIAAMWVTETPPGIIVSEYDSTVHIPTCHSSAALPRTASIQLAYIDKTLRIHLQSFKEIKCLNLIALFYTLCTYVNRQCPGHLRENLHPFS